MALQVIPPHRRRAGIAALLLACAWPLVSQQPTEPEPEPPPPGSIYTLHVYTNLIQVPLLVLNSQNKPVNGLTREQFKINIDSGPAFYPAKLHREDAESLMLATLFDASSTEPELIAAAPDALASLTHGAMNDVDQMALFAFSCQFALLPRAVAVDSAAVTEASLRVLHMPGLQGTGEKHPDCLHKSQLRDSIASTIGAIAKMQKRRAIIVITDGFDRRSKHSWEELRHLAVAQSVAIFAIRSNGYISAVYEGRDRMESVNSLSFLCGQSGGIMLQSSGKDLPATLARIVAMIRSRYILEFPRPSNSTSGFHQMEVKVAARDVRSFATGATALLPQDTELNDPNTVKGDPSRTPVQGNRHPIPR